MQEFIDYYALFGISTEASAKEIKKAYHKLAMKYHPDRNPGLTGGEKKELENKLKEINHIKDILLNPITRREYDRQYQAHQSTAQQLREEQEKLAKQAQRMREEQEAAARQYATEQKARAEQARKYRRDTASNERYQYSQRYTTGYVTSQEERNRQEQPYGEEQDFETWSDMPYNYEEYDIPEYFSQRNHYQIGIKEKLKVTVVGVLIVLTGYHVVSSIFGIQSTQASEQQSQEESEQTIAIIRNYNVQIGDTFSALAEDANCTQKEIKDLNNLDNILYAGQEIQIPYHIPQSELAEYTTTDTYNQEQSLEEFAAIHETTVASIVTLNENKVILTDNGYAITDTNLQVPTFESYHYESARER